MDVSVVVPTYNEKANVKELVSQLRYVLSGAAIGYEIIFVDDSIDETPDLLRLLSKQYSEVKYLHRESTRGLASAVVSGFAQAEGDVIIVMDADLQHPPEMIPLMIQRLTNADIVIPSRFVDGGSDGGLNAFRKLISWTARMIGRLSIKRLREISDCTGGYFALKRHVIEGVQLEPIGWKILMEILVKGQYETVHEIPYTFLARNDGESKMGVKEQWNYLLHIARLIRSSPEDIRVFSFCCVGILGVFVNVFSLAILVKLCDFEALQASIGASFIALLHNYYLNSRITWRDCQTPVVWRRMLQLPQFVLVCGIGIAVTGLFLQQFQAMGWNIYAGQLLGIAVATVWSYSVNNRWTWARSNSAEDNNSKMRVTQEYPHEIS